MSFILLVEQAAPQTPSANQVVVYPKSDGRVYSKDDAGTERAISASAGATTDNAVARYDLTAGALQNSGVIVDDSNNVTGVVALTTTGDVTINKATPRVIIDATGTTDSILDLRRGGASKWRLYNDDSGGLDDFVLDNAGPLVAQRINRTTGDLTLAGDIAAASVSGTHVATQAEQETGTAVNKITTPGRQHFHPGHPKFWLTWNGSGTTILASYNVTSVTNTGVGNETVNIATDFSSADWACFGMGATSNNFTVVHMGTRAAGTLQILATNDILAAVDVVLSVMGLGDQA